MPPASVPTSVDATYLVEPVILEPFNVCNRVLKIAMSKVYFLVDVLSKVIVIVCAPLENV